MRRWSVLVVTALVAVAGSAAAGEAPPPGGAKPDEGASEFVLVDGSKVLGRVPLKEIAVKTAYGRLVMPLADVVSIRVARRGALAADQEVAELIKALGSDQAAEQERARAELLRLGPQVRKPVEAAAGSGDQKLARRAGQLLSDIDRQAEESGLPPLEGGEDEVITKHFTVRGALEADRFELESRYGRLTIPREQVLCARLSTPQVFARWFRVRGEHWARNLLPTGVDLPPGATVKIRASGSIHFRNHGQSSTPAGNPNFGTVLGNFPAMALIARVGGADQPTLIGEAGQLDAERGGELHLGLAWEQNYDRRYTSGEYKVCVLVFPRGSRGPRPPARPAGPEDPEGAVGVELMED